MVAQYRHKVFRYFRRFGFVLAKTYPATNSLHLEIDGRLLLGWPVVYYMPCFFFALHSKIRLEIRIFGCPLNVGTWKIMEGVWKVGSVTVGFDFGGWWNVDTFSRNITAPTYENHVPSPCPAGGKSSTNVAECRTTSTSGKQRAVEFERCQGRRYSQRFTGNVSRRSEESGRCLEDCGKRHDGKSWPRIYKCSSGNGDWGDYEMQVGWDLVVSATDLENFSSGLADCYVPCLF